MCSALKQKGVIMDKKDNSCEITVSHPDCGLKNFFFAPLPLFLYLDYYNGITKCNR